ncbi:MAG TPA: DUF2851 family protein [Verrucomicrobiae bacterium]|nr:DUF2851 family protein [Verrucomicrobiae bacterium]
MDFRADNFYAAWRERNRAAAALHDDGPIPPEKLLQTIWQHQRLQRGSLKTLDGKPLRILHPGFMSVEGGPDFRGAIVQVADAKPVAGDVEIDLQPGGWRAHGHDQNPAFKNVILHVIWSGESGTKSKNQGPDTVLALEKFLDAPLGELARALENESGLPEALRGKCCAPLRELSPAQLSGLLQSAAKVRFQNKAAAILARAKHCGWEQALWENLFRALGYKNNTWPMINLAETRSRWAQGADSAFALQARLLGVSGLLPAELTRSQKNADTFLRRAWDVWWRDRDTFADCTLPRTVWKFHGLRPANNPQRRLALAAHWLASENLAGKIESWIAHEIPDKTLLDSLHQIFQVKRDEFWSWHWTFKSEPMTKPQPLLGEARITDLAVNVVLPWLWTRANEGGNEKIRQEVERRFLAWPSSEDNSVLKLARQRLLGTANVRILKGAAQQQGLMQIVRDFCEHSNAVCAECNFPDLVRGWSQKAAATT